MANFDSYLLGKTRGSVGNVTMCYTRGKNIARAKVFKRKDNPTPENLVQRAKMKMLVQLSRQLLPVIQKGFVGVGNGSTSNAFVAKNMDAIVVDKNYEATIDFDLLKMAFGMLYAPKVVVTYDAESKQYAFQQEMQEEESGYAFADDLVFAVLYETARGRARLVALKSRGESGNTNYALPEEWDSKEVKVYCFGTLKNGREASDSCALTIE